MSVGLVRQDSCRITHGKAQFDVELQYRSGNRLTIHVHPDQRISAAVPIGQPIERVLGRLRARAGWIARQLRHFEQFKPLPVPRRYVSGETILYLGRQYRLRIHKSEVARVYMSGRFICVEMPDPGDRQRAKQLVEGWYRQRAFQILGSRLCDALERTHSLNLAPPVLRFRRMLTRWGSCTKARTIVLHPDLVMVPSQCIDYVIVHELCHRKVLRHNPHFYRLLARYLPDWRRRKDRLDQFVIPHDKDFTK